MENLSGCRSDELARLLMGFFHLIHLAKTIGSWTRKLPVRTAN